MIWQAIARRKRTIIWSLVIFVSVAVFLRHIHGQKYSFVTINQRTNTWKEGNDDGHTAAHERVHDESDEASPERVINKAQSSEIWHLKRKAHNNQFLQSWLPIEDDGLRCKVHIVGCFKPSKSEDSNSWIQSRQANASLTDWKCIQECSKRIIRHKTEMAAVRAGGECICAHYLNYSSLVGEKECNNLCTTDQSSNCENTKQLTRVYQLKGRCSEVAALRIEDTQIGCFERSGSWNNDWVHYISNEDQSSESCFRKCEIDGFPLVAVTDRRSCFCGQMTDKVSRLLEHNPCSDRTRDKVTIYKTVNEDRRCTIKRFLFPGELTRKIGLITFPGSGNTWTRHLIESTTGIYTGSTYSNDWSLVGGGFMGELIPPKDPRIPILKCHSPGMFGIHIDAVLTVYRNPYDAMMAEYKRTVAGHRGNIREDKFNQTAFKIMVMTKLAGGWLRVTQTSAEKKMPRLIIPYEAMVSNPVTYAEKMARFILGENVNEDDLKARLLCLKYSSAGGFKRPKKRLSFDPYDDEMKSKINANIDILAEHLEKNGFAKMPNYKRHIRPTR